MNTMNKENILSKKHKSPWKSPKVNKKQIDKWKELSQSSSEVNFFFFFFFFFFFIFFCFY